MMSSAVSDPCQATVMEPEGRLTLTSDTPGSLRTAGCYFAVIACFLCGAALGGLLLPVLGQWTVLVAAAEQAAVFVWMWIR